MSHIFHSQLSIMRSFVGVTTKIENAGTLVRKRHPAKSNMGNSEKDSSIEFHGFEYKQKNDCS